ncbi:glycoside hydrolase family 88/105 protein [Paenibacillus illinoisensis]|uniref:glycoside hydrolase family 88/105 protein n=1 Tax=Paenibacillus illinoisensis TaxID=59845 RepID=UPI003A4E0127
MLETKSAKDLWAVKTAASIMERTPELYEENGHHGKWSYDYGVVLKGFERLWQVTGDEQYAQYIQHNMDYFIQDNGSIRGYRIQEHNIDHLNNGKLMFGLYDRTGKTKYKLAAGLLREQLLSHPRTSEGAFWHKQVYPYQIWLDGLYMGTPFYLEYLLRWEPEEDLLNDVTKQFILCVQHTRDDATGLLYHAWDEQRVQPWSHSVTGQSPNFWGRSIGWFAMALVDVLELLPAHHPDYPKLVEIFTDTMTALSTYQDTASGVWYQVVNEGERKGNYLEASASSMIVYAMAKGIRLGWLPKEWESVLNHAYAGLISEFVLETSQGWVNLYKNCQVAGLGGDARRDGSYAYYISEPIITNDQKGMGAFLLACTEYEYLLHAKV